MPSLYLLVVAILPGSFGCYRYFLKLRALHADIPSLPRHLIFGNLPLLKKYLIPGAHIDYALEKIYLVLGEPEWFYLDVAPLPFSYNAVVVTSPSIAEQLTRASEQFPYSCGKSGMNRDIETIAGKKTIFKENVSQLAAPLCFCREQKSLFENFYKKGEEWKAIRKQFAPGFQPRYIQTRLPQIIEQVKIFTNNLTNKCRTGEEFELGLLTKALTADVISCMALNQSLHAQIHNIDRSSPGRPGIVKAFEGVQRYLPRKMDMGLSYIDPVRIFRQSYHRRALQSQIKAMVIRSHEESSKSGADSSRSIMSLALTNIPLTRMHLDTAVDQVRSFMFAGYDTTSSLIQWALYYLSLPANASVLADLISEHNQVLGTDKEAIEACLLTNPALPLTTAIIKETLRLEPPAASARYVPSTDTPLQVTLSDGRLSEPLNGTVLYINHHIIQRSTKTWGPDAHEFRPQRWLDKDYMSRIPPGAFRPFERGPRDCIGQELAMLEAKIALALTVRKFRFEKVGGKKGVLGEVWNVYKLTSSPSDGMMMRVSLREKAR